ncbi:MAG: hypothetical protein ACYDDS_21075 [Candidatus Sulfotelmatobacter sp.]
MSCVQLGDTFYWKEGGHLWIVISDPAAPAGEFIIVNLTTDIFRAGRECVLQPNDHQWISEETYVSFGDAKRLGAKEELNLAQQLTLGTIKRHSPMNAVVLRKIVVAGKQTKAMAEEDKALL